MAAKAKKPQEPPEPIKRNRVVKQFCLGAEAEAWLEIKAAQGYNRSRLVERLILEEIKREKAA